MHPLLSSIIAAVAVSLLSLAGVVVLALKEKVLNKILIGLVSFSTGALLGGAFFHLLPEALDEFGKPVRIFGFTLIGFGLFFVLERILRWHHCHEVDCETHKHLGSMNLIGDSFHNFIDGVVIVSSFMVSPALGLAVTLSIIFHEVPQEIGDFGVLLYAGFSKSKAVIYNLAVALTAVLGVLVGYFLVSRIANLNNFLLPFAAGGFIYIAASDLVPELHKQKSLLKSLVSFLIFALAVCFMLAVKLISG
jgi:zinc and cadmium transporter